MSAFADGLDPAANDNNTGYTGHLVDKASGLVYMPDETPMVSGQMRCMTGDGASQDPLWPPGDPFAVVLSGISRS